jgi:2,3-bisphosphoglycerate-independent phosphoglycerate mutase
MKQTHSSEEVTGSHELVRKCALLIIDGLGDLPNLELDGKTPLEAAHTPVFDSLAMAGHFGLVDPIIPGKIPNTHSGTGMLMGLLPGQAGRVSRGPVEASGAGTVLSNGDIAMRANFASVENLDGKLLVTDRRAGRITAGTEKLAAVLKDIDLGDGVLASLVPTDQHRGVLVLSGRDLDAAISNTDPGDGKLPAAVATCLPLNPAATLTAEKVNLFIIEAHKRLVDHPLNIARVADGKPSANCIITRGAGVQFELDNVLQPLGIKAAVVTGCNTVRGLGRIFGFDAIVDSRFTATVDTDLHAKIAAVVSALQDHDLVFLHVKAPDICSHDRKPLAKRDFLQRLDEALKPLLETGSVIAIAADHTTDSNSGFHTADPVPALIWKPNAAQSVVPVKFGESACRQGNMDRQLSSEFLLKVLRAMGYKPAG